MDTWTRRSHEDWRCTCQCREEDHKDSKDAWSVLRLDFYIGADILRFNCGYAYGHAYSNH
jgi:hypothetical protein